MKGPSRPATTQLPCGPSHLLGPLRISFVLFGGMVALQSSPTLDLTKVVYLFGTILCFLGALLVVWRMRASQTVINMIPWLAASLALVALIGISFFVARLNGTPVIDWVRDAAAYGLFAAVAVFALDAHVSVPRRFLVAILLLAGVLGGLSWMVEWLARRDILDLPIARLVFPSGQLPGMLYQFAAAMALVSSRSRIPWTFLAGVILAMFLITGTRSSLILLVGPVAMIMLLGRARLSSSLRPMVAHGIIAAAVVVGFQAAVTLLPATLPPTVEPPDGSAAARPTTTPRPDVLGDRVASLPSLLRNPTSDASMRERIAQYEATWTLFASSPIFGVGLGHPIEWIDVSGFDRSDYTADTPLVMPAKFGVAGILVFVCFAIAYISIARQVLRRRRHSAVAMTLVGYAATTLVGLPLGFPVEDKGASLALILLLGLTLMELRPNNPSRAEGFGEAGALESGPPLHA